VTYDYFSYNGTELPVEQAVIPLVDIHYAYGYGVYETVRVAKGQGRFLEAHCKRLMESAGLIGLKHTFTIPFAVKAAEELIRKNKVGNCNLKIMLLGSSTAEEASLYILCLNPLFPDRTLYKEGAHTITVEAERPFPHAKTLNMLPSYLARRDAKAAGAYDALLIDRHGHITEATGSNFFTLKGRTIFSPPESDILLGVTRDNLLKLARKHDYEITERPLALKDIREYDNAFLTSTSTKVMPIRSIGKIVWGTVSPELRELMRLFDDFIR
jgi:branched-subunit amino acid aminotransferase/4-amino-4-deoxychorismate lyase